MQQSILSFGTATIVLVLGPGLSLWDPSSYSREPALRWETDLRHDRPAFRRILIGGSNQRKLRRKLLGWFAGRGAPAPLVRT